MNFYGQSNSVRLSRKSTFSCDYSAAFMENNFIYKFDSMACNLYIPVQFLFCLTLSSAFFLFSPQLFETQLAYDHHVVG